MAASVLVLSAGLLAAAGPAAAATRSPVRPNQQFLGLVNGSTGVTAPVTVLVACPGPWRPGQTGHPLAGQTLEVVRPEVVVGNFGNTGPLGTSIRVLFGPPPPAGARSATSGTGIVVFWSYNKVKPIPTTLNLPCSGTSTAVFLPLPLSPPAARPAIVPITFVSPLV